MIMTPSLHLDDMDDLLNSHLGSEFTQLNEVGL